MLCTNELPVHEVIQDEIRVCGDFYPFLGKGADV